MPIEYEHGNPFLAALIGSQVGTAQFNRQQQAESDRQFEQELRLAQLAEQQYQFDAESTMRQNQVDLQDQRARQNVGLQFQRDRAANAQQQYNDWQNFSQQAALAGMQNQAGLDRLGYQAQLSLDANEQEWMMDAGQQANVNAKDVLSGYRQMSLSPEGQQLRAQWDAKVRSYQSKQGELRPQVYAAGMNELLSNMQQAGIEDFEQRDVSFDEAAEQQVKPWGEHNVLIRDPSTGKFVINKLQPPPKPEKEQQVAPEKEVIQLPNGQRVTQSYFDTQTRTQYNDAINRVIARKEAENASKGEEAAIGAKFTADPEEIIEEIKRYEEVMNSLKTGRPIEKKQEIAPKPPRSKMPTMQPIAAINEGVTGWIKYLDSTVYMAKDEADAEANISVGEQAILPDGTILEK